MDTEQIQRQVNAHRSAIDAKLALLSQRATDARRTAPPIAIALLVAAAGVLLWRRRRSQALGAPRPGLRRVS